MLFRIKCNLLAAVLVIVAYPSANAQETSVHVDLTNADEVMSAAHKAHHVSCSSPKTRRLFKKAMELGHSYGAINYAESFDPLKCSEKHVDAARAARLYARIAESGQLAAGAVKNWSRLVEKKLAAPDPFKSRIELLSHYGRRFLAVHLSDDVLEMLRAAAIAGDKAALSTLLKTSNFSSYKSKSKHWSKDDSDRVSCTLGEVLIARHPDGGRDDEAIALLKKCASELRLINLMRARIKAGYATLEDRIWLVSTIADDINDFNWSEYRALMTAALDTLSKTSLSIDQSSKVAELIYRVNSRKFRDEDIGWDALLVQFKVARKVDKSKASGIRYADHLFKISRYIPSHWRRPDSVSGSPNSNAAAQKRLQALETVFETYDRSRNELNVDQLRRQLELAWHEIGGARSNHELRLLLEKLADRGDATARNALALAAIAPNTLGHRYSATDYVILADRIVCTADNLRGAIRRQTTLYQRLSRKRGRRRPVSQEISEAALRAVAPRNAVVLFNRDRLKSCVWIISAQGQPAFASIYVSPKEVRILLEAFFQEQKIDADQVDRAPKPKSLSSEDARGAVQLKVSVSSLPQGAALLALSTILFPSDVLKRAGKLERLVVTPYGDIGNIPFDALPLISKEGVFIDHFETSIAPSFIDLFAPFALQHSGWLGSEQYVRLIPGCQKRNEKASLIVENQKRRFKSSLIVGDPLFKDAEFDMPQLSGARSEVENVARIVASQPLLGPEATREAVIKAAPRADLLYFATHGVSYSDNGLNGFIALAKGDRWTAQEVQNTCLAKASLAVLSACQTGLGQNVSGGVIGLARGFQIAGVDDVVMSLWNVSDAATAMLMKEFMKRIVKGEDVASALRQAKIHVRASGSFVAPKYWAGFTLFTTQLLSKMKRR